MRSHFLSRVFYCAELVRGLVGQTICLPGLTIWPSRRKGVEVQCSASHQETLVSNLRMFFSGGQYMYNVYCTEGQLIKRVHICIVGTTPAHLRWHTVPFYTQYHSDSDCTVYTDEQDYVTQYHSDSDCTLMNRTMLHSSSTTTSQSVPLKAHCKQSFPNPLYKCTLHSNLPYTVQLAICTARHIQPICLCPNQSGHRCSSGSTMATVLQWHPQ